MLMSVPTREHTKFSWLDPDARSSYHVKWEKVRRMAEKWMALVYDAKGQNSSNSAELFVNGKDIEQEIKDLEDLSLAAYRAMKLLQKHLNESIDPEDYT